MLKSILNLFRTRKAVYDVENIQGETATIKVVFRGSFNKYDQRPVLEYAREQCMQFGFKPSLYRFMRIE